MSTLLQYFEAYIQAQKTVGLQFIIIGIGLLGIAAFAHFFGESSLSSGFKIGAICCAIFIIAGGFGYRSTVNKLLAKQKQLFEESSEKFYQQETERMQQVVKDYPIYQFAFGAFVIVGLFIIWFAKSPYWHGIAFSVIILFVGVLIAEAFSHHSIKSYAEALANMA